MLTQEKKDKFISIARDLYTKEYMGVDSYGTDKEFEDELTEASANYLISIFYDYPNVGKAKEDLMEVLSHKSPPHPSTLFKILL